MPFGPGRELVEVYSETTIRTVEILLAFGADATAADKQGKRPLHFAARAGLYGSAAADGKSVIQQLVAEGADIKAADAAGSTALHIAVQCDACSELDRVGVVQALIAAGADLAARDSKGDTPLHTAVR